MKKLGRVEPSDWEHFEKYALTTAAAEELLKPTPVVVGVNWYQNFDKPVKDKDGKWWVGRGNLGRIRGGHAVVMPHDNSDSQAWYNYYDQGKEGACVGFAASRMMSLLNKERYDAWWAWNEAKKIDEWSDTNPGDSNGTSVRAVMDVFRTQGHKAANAAAPSLDNGIKENKWAIDVQDVHRVLRNKHYDKIGAIPFHNSWGKSYPKKVWMPSETWNRLLHENGEFAMVTDLEYNY